MSNTSRSEPRRWRLKTVTLRGFRGVSRERTLKFDGRPALLHGNNGTGKSTFSMGLHWVLYGRMPDYVLQIRSPDRFLLSVASKDAEYAGEVVFERNGNEAVFRRDSKGKDFTLNSSGTMYREDQAEIERDKILGLDMLTFARAVLLQQCRIRGLLLDEPKERNQALDRLLGMEGLEVLGGLLRPKEFEKAAESWRAKIEMERQEHVNEAGVLARQLGETQQEAREMGFQNKDFNSEGLRLAVAELATALQDAANAYNVKVEPLPDCDTVKKADAACALAASGIKAIRTNCELERNAKDVRVKLAELGEVKDNWTKAVCQLADSNKTLDTHIREHGDSEAQRERNAELVAQRKTAEDELKAASLLWKLLSEALEYIEDAGPNECPVCERSVNDRSVLIESLKGRLQQMTSDAIAQKEKALNAVKKQLDDWATVIDQTKTLEQACNQRRNRMGDRAQEVARALAIPEIPCDKVESRLDNAISELEGKNSKIKSDLEAMEEDWPRSKPRLNASKTAFYRCSKNATRLPHWRSEPKG